MINDPKYEAKINKSLLAQMDGVLCPELLHSFLLHRTNAELATAIDGVGFSFGYTFTAEAIRIARTEMFTEENGDRPDAKNIMVIITDGLDNVRSRETLQVNIVQS